MRFVGTLLACLFFLAIVSFSVASKLHTEESVITVVNKERLYKGSKDSTSWENFVYTDDDAYVVKDNLLKGHFLAMKVYTAIRPGTCKVTTTGYRVGFLSMYKNIIKADCNANN